MNRDILEVLVKIHNTEDFTKKQFHIRKGDIIIHSRKTEYTITEFTKHTKVVSLAFNRIINTNARAK